MKQKVVCFFLVFSFLFTIPFSSSAVDYNESTLDLSEGSIKMSNAAANSSMTVTDYSSTMVVEDFTYNGTHYNRIYNTNSDYYKNGYTKNVITSNSFTVKANHTYSVSFKSMMNSAVTYSLRCYIYVYDGNGNATDTIILYDFTSNGGYGVNNHSFDFNLSNSQLPAGYSLKFGVTQTVSQLYGYNWKWSITDISYTDNDDNTGLLNTIISAIGVVWNAVKDIGSDITTGFSNLGSKISNSFDNLNQWLTNVKNSIVDKLIDVRDSITNKLSDIKNDITDKITELKNYLLYFQSPVTVNSDGIPIGADGQPVYTNPFSSALEAVKSYIDEWTGKIQDFVNSINFSGQNVSEYISVFTNAYNRFSAGVPVLMAVVSFGFVFIVIKKVVGR